MLTRRVTAWVLACALATLTLVAGSTAPAQAAPEGCIEYQDDFGNVVVDCSNAGGNDGGGNDGGGNGGGDGGGSDISDRECTHHGQTIPCETGAGIWNSSCYAKIADPQPDKDHPAWGGREDGVIIRCTNVAEGQACDATGGCDTAGSFIWAAGPPDAGPTPLELAERAVAQMQLTSGDIGATPTGDEGDAPAIYGFPTWLWVDNPAPNTTGPITTTASDGGLTVTATAALDRIEYTMGDGGTVTCAGSDAPGTRYAPSYDPPGTTAANAAHSPTCGYMYTDTSAGRPGNAFTITATSYWTVEWSGGGQNGTIPVDQTTSRQHQVSEVQVILTHD